ncbi:MAG: hypothetical protein ACYTGL_04185 [Planctomycetota bacterium]|jgi:hypothetical protein
MQTFRLALATATGLALAACLPQFASQSGTQTSAEEPAAVQPAPDARPADKGVVKIPIEAAQQGQQIRPYMHAKLVHSQTVLAGLVTKDFDRIETAAERLMLTSLDTPAVKEGENREDEVYDHMRTEFLRLAGRLKQMAEKENLEGAAFVHEKLNGTCIACHQYLRDELPKTPTK